MITIATEAQVRARLATEKRVIIDVKKGERAWDPISKTGWTRGAGRICYDTPEPDGFVSVAWVSDSGRGSSLRDYEYDRRHGVTYR